VTNTGASTIFGDLGVSPGTAVTGFPPGIVTVGATHAADAVALQAQSDVTTAYDALAAQACTADTTGQDLGGQTLTQGVYCSTSSTQLTGTLTLDAQGNAAAVFIFKTVSTLTTASSSSVQVINGGTACNVFWQIGSSATVGTTTQFAGNILALTSIALQNGASVAGRALARNGEVTMDTNNVTNLGCPGAPAAPTATPAPSASPTPPPAGQLPPTGGVPLESDGLWWALVLVASVMGSLGAVLLGLSAPVHRRRQ
jgi:type VI secretion system secreted protein VgrG